MKNRLKVVLISAAVGVAVALSTSMLVSSEIVRRGGFVSISRGFPLAFFNATYPDLMPASFTVMTINLVIDSAFWVSVALVGLAVVNVFFSNRKRVREYTIQSVSA